MTRPAASFDAPWDALVVGGGLAGAVVAWALARQGRAVLVCEREGAAQCRPGELVGPNTLPFLDALGLTPRLEKEPALAIPCAGVRTAWRTHGGDHREFLLEPGGRGFAVDRLVLGKTLREAAGAAGAVWAEATQVTLLRREAGLWRMAASSPEGSWRPVARIVIDASGRAARIARLIGARRIRAGHLLALHVCWRGAPPTGTTLRVAAEPEGWWYGLGVPSGHALAFLTDPAELRGAPKDRRAWLCAMLRSRRILPGPAAEAARRGTLTLCDASAAALDHAAGDGWLAVGDAAASFDPLASQGIAHAFGSALASAAAARAWLDGDATALPAYAEAVARGWRHSVAGLLPIYLSCRHAGDGGFYHRRARALRDHEEVRGADPLDAIWGRTSAAASTRRSRAAWGATP